MTAIVEPTPAVVASVSPLGTHNRCIGEPNGRNIWAADPEPVIEAERLAPGDVNVDIKCAVKLTALMRRPMVLPLVRIDWLNERIRDKCGRLRSPATIGSNRRGLPPGNAGKTYRPAPLTPDEMAALLAAGGSYPAAVRDRALIGFLWRTGLRISEALALHMDDLNFETGQVIVRHGKNDRYGISGIDPYGIELLAPWLAIRARYANSLLFAVVEGPSRGDQMSASSFRTRLHRLGREAGITKRVHPHGFRHTCAVELSREKVPLALVQRQLRHTNPGTTGRYLVGTANEEVMEAINARPAPFSTPVPEPLANTKAILEQMQETFGRFTANEQFDHPTRPAEEGQPHSDANGRLEES